MSRNLTWLLSMTLVLMLALSVGLILKFSPNRFPLSDNQTNHPDTFVVQATYLRLDPNGQLQSKFFIPKVVHYAKDNRSEFSSPHIVIYDQDKHPWVINAEHGQSQFGTQQIELWGNVKVQHFAVPQQPEVTLLTSRLKYFPEQQLAQTDQPVTIVQPGMVVHSLGLKADLKSASVLLISNVRARYEVKTN
ncbi:MAG: LPS export ABC transporter periplasmic protein LptC [Gammaproteobacteria bacterium]